jgi:hypothetical protein
MNYRYPHPVLQIILWQGRAERQQTHTQCSDGREIKLKGIGLLGVTIT